MLKRIAVKDFQNHQTRTIDLDRHVTVFVGDSDTGKSAIAFRAIRWVSLNQPLGDEMIRWGAKRAVVRLVFDDCEIVRNKGETANLYLLDGKERKAFGAGKVPDDVAKALRLDPINFQGQHDAAFWLSDTAGKVSQELNRVVDLSVIDNSISAADSALRRAKATREVCEERLAKAEAEAKNLAWVEAMSAELDSINSLYAEVSKAENETEDLDELVYSLNSASEIALEATERAKASRGVADAAEATWRATQEQQSLSQLLADLAEAEANCRIEVPDLSGMKRDLEERDSIMSEISELESLLEELAEAEKVLWQRTKDAARSAENLSRASENCPLCGSEWNHS